MKLTLPVFLSCPQEQIESSPISSLAPKILTDKKDIEKAKPYLDSLAKTINQKGITNIAITGGYGSGKSTIIKTFQSLNPQHEYLNISLASFNDVIDEKGNPKAKKEDLERLLEVSILQQIFYHVKPSDIPDSRFKRIINITDEKIISIALGLIFWILSILILFKFNFINKLNPTTWKANYSLDWVAIITALIFLTGIGLFAKTVVRLFSNSKINKFNIRGELELGDNLDKSVFNQHLEEIIYFFERTKFDVVVIEDLDRFDNTDIFTKLREINILLNNSKLIEREINFIYAIKDEMFKDKSERVKFFEYIIPVIPFINPSTAGDQLTKLIEEAGLKDVLSKDFTEDVVTFIDDIDMRLLINIFHEYQLYKRNLISDLDQNCLFAMITYKNLFPDDFGDLQKRKGNLYKFISKKGDYIKSLIKNIDKKIDENQNEIKNINQETSSSIDELRMAYISHVIQKIPNAISLYLDDVVLFSNLLEESNLNKLKESKNIHYNYYSTSPHYRSHFVLNNNNASNVSFSDIENYLNPDFTLDEREELVESKNGDRIEVLRAEIEKLKTDKLEVESWSLERIFEQVDIDPYLDVFSENELTRNLLLNGYINESYNDYISIFHEVNLTKEDYSFERSVKSAKHSPFDYKLTKIENLVKKLPEKYFSRESILNFDLLDFLAANYEAYKKEYDLILVILSNDKKNSSEFIENYIDNRKGQIELFIKSLCKSWSGFWNYVLIESNFTKEKMNYYLEIIIKYGEIEDIFLLNKNSNLNSYISQKNDFLSLINDESYTDKIKEVIKILNVKFVELEEPNNDSKEISNYVYENHFYQINIHNVVLILSVYQDGFSLEKTNESNYTTIINSKCDPLINYINANLNQYVKNVLLKIPENIHEAENAVIMLLNNEEIEESQKSGIISKMNTIINNLNDIDSDKIQDELLSNNKISATWENIFAYGNILETKELNEILIGFLNEETNYTPLSKSKIKVGDAVKEDFIKDFSANLVKCNKLDFESYTEILKSSTYKWTNIKIEHLEQDKVEWLVKQYYLSLSVENYTKLKDNFPDLHLTMIVKNQTLFFSKFGDYTLDKDDIIKLLNSNAMTEASKVQLIEKIDDSIIIENANIGDRVCTILSNSNFVPLEYNVLESLIKHSNSNENKVKLINKHFDTISEAQIKGLVEMLGYHYPDIFKKQHKPKFGNYSYNAELFNNLSKRSLIKRYEKDAKDNDLLKVIANY